MKKEKIMKLKIRSIGKMIIVKFVNFPLHVNPTTFDVEKEKMSYGDFIIKKEQIFEEYFFRERTHVERSNKKSSIFSQKFF